jgi:hypothetical protein
MLLSFHVYCVKEPNHFGIWIYQTGHNLAVHKKARRPVQDPPRSTTPTGGKGRIQRPELYLTAAIFPKVGMCGIGQICAARFTLEMDLAKCFPLHLLKKNAK